MKLSFSIGSSICSGVIVATGAWFYVTAYGGGLGFWERDPIAGAWAMLGGAGGIGVVAYALLSFVFLSGSALNALHQARVRLIPESTDPGRLPEVWQSVWADTEFASLVAQLPGEELTIAPLALLRVLRYEIWRVYANRLIATQLVTIGLTCAALVVARYSVPIASTQPGAALFVEIFAALALIIVLGAWLLIDDAIRDLAATVSGIGSLWEAELRGEPSTPLRRGGPASASLAARSETIVAAIDKLAATITTPSAVEADAATLALAAIEVAVRESATRQEVFLGNLGETLTTQIGLLARSFEQRDADASGDLRGTSEALIQLAAAVDRLADPLLRRLRLLDTADRRLLTVLRRQEEAVASVGTKWSELVTALQAMSAGLDRFAQAASDRYEEVVRLQPGGSAEPMDVTEELQELLDEMSDDGETDLHRPAG